MATRDQRRQPAGSAPPLHRILLADLKRGGLGGHLRADLSELFHFYLDDETQTRLARMGRIRRLFWMLGWLVKSLFLKLSPARRLLLLIAFIMALFERVELAWLGRVEVEPRFWAVVVVVIILMLELKDKLAAHDEIDVARDVQLDLLPREPPRVAGWEVWTSTRPANDVGGDLVDHLEAHSEVGLVLGDVAGKGMGAALLMAKLQATLRALAGDHPDLAELAGRLNDILHRDGLENRFATFFYATLRPGTGQVRWVNAGHNPAYLLRPTGVRELEASGLPLGVLPGTTYTEGSLDLAPGELLAIYSDGLSEAADADDQEYGAGRLASLLPEVVALPLPDAGAAILADVERFTRGQRLQDDLSLVLIRRAP